MLHGSSGNQLRLPKKSYKAGDLPNDIEGWTRYVNKVHDQALDLRRKYEFVWALNYCYYLGYTNIFYRDGVIQIPSEGRLPLSINRVGSFIESRHSKLTKSKPVPRVIPDTQDRDDINAAKYSDQLLTHLWRKTGVLSEFDRMIMQMLICNVSFFKTDWDSNIGDYIIEDRRDSDSIVIDDESGEVASDKIFMGDVSTRTKSALDILIANDSIPTIADQAFIIERVFRDVSDLETDYPHMRGKIKKQDQYSEKTEYERLINRLYSPAFAATGGGAQRLMDSINTQALAKLFYMKPNYQYEKGVVAVVIGKELAAIDTFPNCYGDNIYPYVKFQEKEPGFGFYGQATLEKLIPIQRAYNELKDKVQKNVRRMANGKYLLAKGSQVHESAIDDDSGEILEFNPAVPAPSQMAIAPLPNYVANHTQDLINDFREVANQTETSLSPSPNLTAGIAMQTQAELSDQAIAPIIQRVARSMELVANMQLCIINEEYIEPRKIKIIGDDGKVGVQWLSRTNLKNHTDVHIEIESMFPDLRGAKRQTLLDLWDRRIVSDPVKVLKAFKYGSFEHILEEETAIEDTVYLAIAELKRGKMPEISPFADPMLYVKKFIAFMNTPEFLRLIPERKQLFIQITQQFMGKIMQSMPAGGAPQAQQNPAVVGTPSGPQTPVGAPGSGPGIT